VRKFIVIACVAFVVPAMAVSKSSAQSTPPGTPICDLPQYVGTPMYNKYCAGSAPSVPEGGGFTAEQQLGAQLGSLGVSMIIQGLQQMGQQEAARQAAAAQAAQAAAQRAAAEQQRRAAELTRRAEELRHQLIGGDGEADPSTSLSPMDVDDTTDMRPMNEEDTADLQPKTGDQSPSFNTKGSQTASSQPSTGCTPSQDPSVVDLCGRGGIVDPSIVKNGDVASANPPSPAGTTVDPTAVKQGGPCPFVNGKPQCGQAFKMERNQPCPLDANGVPQCGAPVSEEMPGGNASALPAAPSAPPIPSQSAYDPNLSGQARQDAAARSAYQAASEEDAGVAHDGAQLQHQAANVAKKAAVGAAHGAEFGPGGATLGGALGAGEGAVENRLDSVNGN